MRKHDIFFFASISFITGIVIGSFGVALMWSAATSIFSALLLMFFKINRKSILIVAVFFFMGSFYYTIDDYFYQTRKDFLKNISSFEGIAIDAPKSKIEYQIVKLKLTESKSVVILQTDLYPQIHYGDILKVDGKIILPLDDSYGKYLAKERIHGTVFYPKVEILGNNSNLFFKILYKIRSKSKDFINILFTHTQSLFLSGILLGDRDEFGKDFQNKLSLSGTMHITALSGLHISIVIFIVSALFSGIFGKKRDNIAFFFSFLSVGIFVALTGFAVSAIRAALMAGVAGLGEKFGRIRNQRNVITFAALFIVAQNPKSIVFDVGFQLSFLATLAIIYFAPVLKRFKFFKQNGFLNWREILQMTLSAQIGVLPVTMVVFGNFSLSAFPANMFLLSLISPLMILGFLLLGSSFSYLSVISFLLSKPIAFLTDYSIGIINFFSEFKASFNPDIGAGIIILYYLVLIWICAKFSPKIIFQDHVSNR